MKKYVLGFAFDRERKKVVLIEKQKPEWQKGKHNGVGGKIEPEDNSPLDAMYREFKEETGVDCSREGNNAWKHFATMLFNNETSGQIEEVYCFRMFSNVIYQCLTMEEEKIKIFNLLPGSERSLQGQPIISNLDVLIPMALDENFIYAELNLK